MATYYPRAADPASAIAIEVSPGAQLRGIDFVLSKSRTVHIRGRVNSASGKGMITVMLAPSDQTRALSINRTYTTDPQGRFDIRGVSPGAYTFIAAALELTGHVRVEGTRRPICRIFV